MKSDLRRIIVRGTSGSGKTTMARALSEKLGIVHTELDANYHLPNWNERPQDELQQIIDDVIEHDRWIIDGNYRSVMQKHQEKADLVIWLDYPFFTVLRQLLVRTTRRSVKKEELWNGNRETFRKSFLSSDSILWWMITTHKRQRAQCDALQNELQSTGVKFLRFRRPRDADQWLAQLK